MLFSWVLPRFTLGVIIGGGGGDEPPPTQKIKIGISDTPITQNPAAPETQQVRVVNFASGWNVTRPIDTARRYGGADTVAATAGQLGFIAFKAFLDGMVVDLIRAECAGGGLGVYMVDNFSSSTYTEVPSTQISSFAPQSNLYKGTVLAPADLGAHVYQVDQVGSGRLETQQPMSIADGRTVAIVGDLQEAELWAAIQWQWRT